MIERYFTPARLITKWRNNDSFIAEFECKIIPRDIIWRPSGLPFVLPLKELCVEGKSCPEPFYPVLAGLAVLCPPSTQFLWTRLFPLILGCPSRGELLRCYVPVKCPSRGELRSFSVMVDKARNTLHDGLSLLAIIYLTGMDLKYFCVFDYVLLLATYPLSLSGN